MARYEDLRWRRGGLRAVTRFILAAVLMALVFVVGQNFLFPTPETPPASKQPPAASKPAERAPAAPSESTTDKSSSSSPQKEGQNKVQAPPTPTPPQPRGERPPQRLATVITPLYRAVVSSEGGKLQELTLTYRGDKPMVIVGELGPGGLVAGPPGQAQAVPMQLSTTDLRLGPDRLAISSSLVSWTAS